MKPTTEKGFREKIRQAARGCGTYKPEFEPLICRLAEVYFRRQQAQADFEKSGGNILVQLPGKNGGKSTPTKNPLLVEVDDLSDRALTLERELGLTPASLRRVNESAMPKAPAAAQDDPLAAALGNLRVVS